MTAPTEAQRRTWMAQWRSAAVALERVRLDELGAANLTRIADDLEDACMASVRANGFATTSGLVEQQALLHRRHRG